MLRPLTRILFPILPYYPFCTSYESPMSEADATLRKGYPDLDWKPGLRLPAPEASLRAWLAR